MSITADARLTSKGQVTIPKEIRDRLGLEEGQEIEFVLHDDGSASVRPKKPPMERLRDVKATVTANHEDIDVAELRRKSKREWDSVDTDPSGDDG